MNDKIKHEMERIPIPASLHQRSMRGIQQAKSEMEERGALRTKRSNLRYAAMAIFGGVLISAFLFNTQVVEAIQKALQFLPGVGVIQESNENGDRYVLEEAITVPVDGGEILITAMFVDEQMTYIEMSGTNTEKLEKLTVINQEGTEFIMDQSAGSWTTDKWAQIFYNRGTLDIGDYATIVLGDADKISVPVQLVAAETFDSYLDMGETAVAQGVGITAIAGRAGDKARISLVSPPSEEYRINNYGLSGVTLNHKARLTDQTGISMEIETYMGYLAPKSDFYFPLSDDPSTIYTLIIPEINAVYDDSVNVSLDIPSEGTKLPDLSFEIAGFPVKVTKVERIDNMSLRVYFDVEYDEEAPASLHMFSIDQSHMARMNEQSRALQFIQFEIEPNDRTVEFLIKDPEVVIRGPWEFKLPASKYFNSGNNSVQ